MGAALKSLAALKLRFEIEAQRSPGARRPGFITTNEAFPPYDRTKERKIDIKGDLVMK